MNDLVQRYHRLGEEIPLAKLLAVSKTRPFSEIVTLYQLGQHHFGEARLRELQEKAASAQTAGMVNLRWHYIGRLQRKQITPLLKIPQLYSIHSVASLPLLEELMVRAHVLSTNKLGFFLQFNTGQDPQKAGFATDEDLAPIFSLLRSLSPGPLQFSGLMCMAPISDLRRQQQAFAGLRQLRTIFHQAGLPNLQLSMGMSGDYRTALEYGSDWVRLGSALFSPAP